jgi:hypothetical protein
MCISILLSLFASVVDESPEGMTTSSNGLWQ